MTDRHRVIGICVVLAAAAIAVLAIRDRWPFPFSASPGPLISNETLAIQLAALVGGIAAVHLVAPERARSVIAIEGAVVTLAFGWVAIVYLAGLAAWYAVLSARLGPLRWPCLVVLLAIMYGSAWTRAHHDGFLFSMTFTLRLLVFAWDRWRNDFERVPFVDYAAYMLLSPIILVRPFFAIIPLFDGFAERVQPGMSPERLRRIGRHALLAGVAAALKALLALTPPIPGVTPLASTLIFAGALGHGMFCLLLLHGIEERLPIDRPLLATRYVELWSRYYIHLKDLQVAMFYAPALLALRRVNRYAALILATAWTLLIGNFLVHAAVAYGFYAATVPNFAWRMGLVTLVNGIIAVALAIDLCRDEYRRRHGSPQPSRLRAALGWVYTMTVLAICSSML
jgi:hypothetical protein